MFSDVMFRAVMFRDVMFRARAVVGSERFDWQPPTKDFCFPNILVSFISSQLYDTALYDTALY